MDNMYGIIEGLCESNGIKPGKLCSELGISRGTLSDLKAGRTKKLSADNAQKIADYFSVTTDYLYGREEKEKLPADEDQELNELLERLKNRKECRMLFQLADGATADDVRKAVAIIEALRNEAEESDNR